MVKSSLKSNSNFTSVFMGSKQWHLAVNKKQSGQLDKVHDYLGSTHNLKCSLVTVPISMDEKLAISVANCITSSQIRGFELWWNGADKELSLVLVAQDYDLDTFKQSFSNMYPNADFADLGETIPDWFVETDDYQVFDISTYHGHYATVFDSNRAHQIITQIAKTIQISKFAWIQFVFKSHNFNNFFQRHVGKLDRKYIEISTKKHQSITSLLINPNREPKPHLEFGRDFYNNYKALSKHATTKMQSPHVLMSIRGLIQSDEDVDLNFDKIESMPAEDISSNFEHLVTYKYNYKNFFTLDPKKQKYIKIQKTKTREQKIAIFKLRLLPNPTPFTSHALSRYFERRLFGYDARVPLPFLILTSLEIPLFIHLPNPTTPNIRTTRSVVIPQQLPNKFGINMGFFKRSSAQTLGTNPEKLFGKLVRSSDSNASIVSVDDFSRHMYLVGATGTGKTSLIRTVAKHLEMLNLNGKFPNSFIYLDPKGDDSFRFFQQCQKESIDSNCIHFLDPSLTKFSINPLELPPYDVDKRDDTVSRYVGYFMEIIKQWYSQNQSFVQMERIFRALLFYLYSKNDAPTFLDIHGIVTRIQENGKDTLQEIFHFLGKPDSEMKQALESIASLRKDSFTPLLNRVEQFATDDTLKEMFCVSRGTVNFADLIAPGHYTIVRISALNVAHHIQPLAIQAFIIKLWFSIQERAARVPDEHDRTQVVLALDEFQIVKDLQVLPLILSQARSYHLGLILAHQTTAQISDKLLEEITGNCGTQFSGKVSGRDAGRIAQIWDPQFSQQIQQLLAAQEDFHWTIKMRAAPGEEQPPPMQFWLHHTPKLHMDTNDKDEFIALQKKKYGYGKVGKSLMEKYSDQSNYWLKNITVELPTHDEWLIYNIIGDGSSLGLRQIVDSFRNGIVHRDVVSEILKSMVEQGKLGRSPGNKGAYFLSNFTQLKYLTFDHTLIGTAQDIKEVMESAISYYTKLGYFVGIANQSVKKGKLMTDLVAYDYVTRTSISVEIESISEFQSHKEHVKLNMLKWRDLGFMECHVWSKHKGIQDLFDTLSDEEKMSVCIFVV